jgi:hypothetical protein
MRWAGYATHIGETRNVYRVLVENPLGSRSLYFEAVTFLSIPSFSYKASEL